MRRGRQALPLPRSAQVLWGRWQARVPVRPRVLKQWGQQRVKQQAKQRVWLPLEPMGPQQVGIFF